MAAHLSHGRVDLNVLRVAVRRELREFLDKCAGSKVRALGGPPSLGRGTPGAPGSRIGQRRGSLEPPLTLPPKSRQTPITLPRSVGSFGVRGIAPPTMAVQPSPRQNWG